MTNTTNPAAASVTAILFEHEDGRYAINPNTTGDPAWHRLGPVDVSALATPAQAVPAPGMPSDDVRAKIESNTWDHFGDILPTLKAISRGDWYWGMNSRCKYVEVRIDTRDGGCILYDRERVRISPEQFAFQAGSAGKMEPWPAANAPDAPEQPAAPAQAGDTLRMTAIEELAQLGYTFDGSKVTPPDFVGELLAVVRASPCGCRAGECESKSDRVCRMTTEIAATCAARGAAQAAPADLLQVVDRILCEAYTAGRRGDEFGLLAAKAEAAAIFSGAQAAPVDAAVQRDAAREPLSDEQIDRVADSMPGGVQGFLKGWGYRQFARSILALRAMPTWEPEFDCMTPGQEELVVQFCAEIAGKRGAKGRTPDPVRLLEMAEALYKAERAAAHGINSARCWCQTCRPITPFDCRMVLCPDCGNKRCPKANDHRHDCTGSNEPGQPGSAYPAHGITAAPKGGK